MILFSIFSALRGRPSSSTRHMPPRIWLVSTRSRSLKFETSSFSVGSPLISTGTFAIMNSISSLVGWYCFAVTLE